MYVRVMLALMAHRGRTLIILLLVWGSLYSIHHVYCLYCLEENARLVFVVQVCLGGIHYIDASIDAINVGSVN